MVTRTKKIFVGGVSASTTEEDLTNYFKQHGEVCGPVTFVTVKLHAKAYL